MSNLPASDFSADLPIDVAELLRNAESEINTALELQTDSVITIGTALTRVKARLNHGEFGDWVTASFSFGVRTAQRYMVVSEQLAEHQSMLSPFGTTALYALAVAPDTVRGHVLEEIEAGKLRRDDEVRARIDALKPTPPLGSEVVSQREAIVADGLAPLEKWSARRLSKLISALKIVSNRDLVARLENFLPARTSSSQGELGSDHTAAKHAFTGRSGPPAAQSEERADE